MKHPEFDRLWDALDQALGETPSQQCYLAAEHILSRYPNLRLGRHHDAEEPSHPDSTRQRRAKLDGRARKQRRTV